MQDGSTQRGRKSYSKANEIAVALRETRFDHVRSGKEIVRHAALKIGASRLMDYYSQKRGYLVLNENGQDPGAVFSKIYDEGGWIHSETQESRSGLGSSVAATSGLFNEICSAMAILGAQSLVDVGCGDWNWMSREEFSISYTGVDVVPSIIEENSKHSRENVNFKLCDVTKEVPPKADMALCREVLFHLSFDDAKKAIDNIKKSVKYICATSDTTNWFNSDIRTGGYRALNLFRRPFRFPEPVYLIEDSFVTPGRILGIWHVEQLPE